MASASTADTWREPGTLGGRRSTPRAPRPEGGALDEYVTRLPRPPVPPRPSPSQRVRSTDAPPFPEHLARAARGGPADPGRPSARPARGPAPDADRARSADRDLAARGSAAPRRAARGSAARGPGARPVDGRRSAPVRDGGGRIRGVVAVLAVFLVTLAGAAADSFLGAGLGMITLGALTAATVVATAVVRRRDLVTTVVAPPLVFAGVAALNLALAPSAQLTAYGLVTLVVRGFPTMAVATAAGLVVALLRWAARR